jgi:hypothetical protein
LTSVRQAWTKDLTRELEQLKKFYNFEHTVKHENRYLYGIEVINFLKIVIQKSKKRTILWPKGKELWRAQLGCVNEPIPVPLDNRDETLSFKWNSPYPPERMIPLCDEATEGRVNPKGIPCLYLATDRDTAVAQVRPWTGSFVTVGKFKIRKKVKLINCLTHCNNKTTGNGDESAVWNIWEQINEAFSKPITNNDKSADYVPTQILSELFRKHKFDGIIYKSVVSVLSNGDNVALFDLNAVELICRKVYEVKKLHLDFSLDEVLQP